jgi:hypothetical protein
LQISTVSCGILTTSSGDLRTELFAMIGREKVASVLSSFREEDYSVVARNLGIERAEVSRVISELKT